MQIDTKKQLFCLSRKYYFGKVSIIKLQDPEKGINDALCLRTITKQLQSESLWFRKSIQRQTSSMKNLSDLHNGSVEHFH